jgi:glycine/D-amino acid oxidase-like deaminating enzyme
MNRTAASASEIASAPAHDPALAGLPRRTGLLVVVGGVVAVVTEHGPADGDAAVPAVGAWSRPVTANLGLDLPQRAAGRAA